jgi:putative glutamine amidotransferase
MSQQNKEVIKVYQSGCWYEGGRTFIKNSKLVANIEEADIIILPGGADIDPSIYGKKKHETVHWLSPERDAREIADFNAVRPDQVVLGICRGAQLLCALFGGILVQNCHRHIGCDHSITNGEKEFNISSIHHQMMYPFDMPKEDYEILYRSTRRLSDVYEGDGVDPQKIIENGEPEIVLFHKEGKPLSLAVQGHPEMMPGSPVSNMISDLLISYVHELKSKGE